MSRVVIFSKSFTSQHDRAKNAPNSKEAHMPSSVITTACRTPIGSFGGVLSTLSAAKLSSITLKELLQQSGVKAEDINEVIMGCVLPAGQGQSPARQAALGAGLPTSVGVVTINKVCGSGLKAVMLADQSIRSGDASIVAAGGMENMSQVPYYLPKARTGLKMGNGEIIDGMVHDGLWDPYNNFHMGVAGEMCVKEFKFTRDEQDAFAAESYKRAQDATETGLFKDEIIPVEIPQRQPKAGPPRAEKGNPIIVDKDEEPFKVNFDKIGKLRPAFDKEGTITAANASSINDGAAAVLVMSDDEAKKRNLTPLVKIVGSATHSQAPEWFTTAPAKAVQKVLDKTGLKIEDIDLFEINEAFACVAMAAMKELNIPHEKVNVNGGAVALGHPIGASGARILTTLIYAMKKQNAKRGLATLCIGGGEAVAMIVEGV